MSLCYKLDAVCIENTIYLFIDEVLMYRFYIHVSIVCYFCMIFFVFYSIGAELMILLYNLMIIFIPSALMLVIIL